MAVNDVGWVHQGVEVIGNRYARRADIPSHIAQVCTVSGGFMAASQQTNRQIADVQLGASPVCESVISNQNSQRVPTLCYLQIVASLQLWEGHDRDNESPADSDRQRPAALHRLHSMEAL